MNRSATALPSTAGEDAGRLVLRLALGVLMLLHGLAKITAGPGFIMGLLAKAGLPAFLAWGVYVGEVVAPLLIILGLWTRAAALVVAINMVVAVALVHLGDLARMTPQGGWALELQGLFLFSALALALLGAGRWSLGGVHGRWN